MTYECGFCHKEYETPQERMTCENNCYRQLQQEEEHLRREQAEREREKEEKAIEELMDKYNQANKDLCTAVKNYNAKYKNKVWIKDHLPSDLSYLLNNVFWSH